MASGPITSWQIDEGKMETVTDFIFLGSITGTAAMKFKKCFFLGRKAMTNLDSILQGRAITLLTEIPIVKAVIFPGVGYGCES